MQTDTYYRRKDIRKLLWQNELEKESTGKPLQKRRGGFATKKEAKNAYLETMKELRGELEELNQTLSSIPESTITFGDFVENYFKGYYQNYAKASTYGTRKSILNNTFIALHALPINAIGIREIERWLQKLLNERREKGLNSNDYVRLVIHLLAQIFDYAIKLGFCSENHARNLKKPPKGKTNIGFWDMVTYNKVISTFCLSDFYQFFCYTIIHTLFMTGMRIGEAMALTWEDIDFENKCVAINKTMRYDNAHSYESTSPKSASSIRKISLDDTTLSLLKDWQMRQLDELKTEADFVFSYNGLPTNKSTIGRVLKRHAKIAEVDKITPHGLRHSHASLLIHLGEDPLMIQKRLGHSNIQMTLEKYGHLYPARDQQLVSKLAGLFTHNQQQK